MNRKRFFLIIFVTALSLSMLFSTTTKDVSHAADKVIKWKCEVHWPAASVSYKDSAQVVIDRIKKRTNGRLDIELYAAGALVPPKEIFNAVKRGMLEIAVSAVAYYRSQVPLASVASGLPYNFKEVWECAYYHQWLGFERTMKDALAKHDLLYFTDKVYPTELALKKPVKSMADFKGLKLRSSGASQIYLTSIGAAASYLPGGEVYAALASGVVDGAHWGAVQGSDSMGFYDVCKYHLRPALNIAATDSWLINKKAFEKLPQDIQKIVTSTLEEQFWLRTNQYIYLENQTLGRIQKEKGVHLITIPDDEYVKMKEAALKMWDDVAQKSPECAKAVQMLKDFQKSLGR